MSSACPAISAGLPRFLQRELGRGDGDVGVDVALEETAALHHHADLPAQGFEVHGGDVPAVIVHRALLRLLEAEQDAHQGGLAAAGLAHDGHILPGANLEGEIIQHQGHGVVVAEGNVVQLDAAPQPGDHLAVQIHLRLRLQNGLHQLQNRSDLRNGDDNTGQRGKGAADHAVGAAEGHVVRHRQPGADGGIVEGDGPQQRDGRGDGTAESQEHGRLVQIPRRIGILFAPPGEGTLFRTGVLDLRNAAQQRIDHAALLAGLSQLLFRDTHLHQGRDEREGRGQV